MTQKKIHIVLVNRCYPPHTGFGGIATYHFYLARALARAGHKVTVLAARWAKETSEKSFEEGVEIHRLLVLDRPFLRRIPVLKHYSRPVMQWLYSRRVASVLAGLEKSEMPDLVEFADIEAEGFWYLKRKKRSRVSVRCHTPSFVLRKYYNPEEMPYDTDCISQMEKFCIRNADVLTAPSGDMARVIAAECGVFAEKIHVIPNALDTEIFKTAENIGKQKNGVTVLHVGRLQRAKGVGVLMSAIPEILKRVPETRFVFVGSDYSDGAGSTWRKRIETELAAKNAAGCIEFTGDISFGDLREWYGRAAIAVVPSLLYESFSYTSAQAMAAGVPVVASRIGGIPETVKDGVSGILFETGNADELASAVIRLASNPELRLRMGNAGREDAKRFNADRISADYLKVAGL